MEWRKPDEYPDEMEDVLIFYKNYFGSNGYGLGWYNGIEWRTYFDKVEKCLAWMPLPPEPNFEKDEKEN